MKVILTGLPYFTKKLANQLQNYNPKIKFIPLDTNGNRKDKIKFLWHIFSSKVLYFLSSGIDGSYATDIAIMLNKKVIMNWAGTDVLKAIKNFESGNHKKKYFNKVHHYCVAPWLQEELKGIGIEAEILPVTVLSKIETNKLSFPEKPTILTYIGKGREEFYGINTVIKLAKEFKEINFRVFGIDSYKDVNEENIEFLGWVEDIGEEYKACTAYLRDTEHDGMPFTIIEAMSYGRPVFFNKEFPFIKWFKNFDELKTQIQDLLNIHNEGKLKIDTEAIEFVQKEFGEAKILENIIKIFSNVER